MKSEIKERTPPNYKCNHKIEFPKKYNREKRKTRTKKTPLSKLYPFKVWNEDEITKLFLKDALPQNRR